MSIDMHGEANIVRIPPKTEQRRYRGHEYTVSFDVLKREWHWRFDYTVRTTFFGRAHTLALAHSEARGAIDTLTGNDAAVLGV